MRIFVKVLCVVVALFASQLAIADSAISQEASITVSVAANVQDEISKLTPAEKMRVEETINVGNKFIQKHFDHSAYEANPENEDWIKYVAPLVSMDVVEWSNQDWMPLTKEIKRGGKVGGTRLTCPQVILISVLRHDGTIILSYRTPIMGMLIDIGWWGNWLDLSPDIGTYEVSIVVNASNQIFKVLAQDNVMTMVYIRAIHSMNIFLKNPRHFRSIDETQADDESKILRYKKLIEQMNQQAARVCK